MREGLVAWLCVAACYSPSTPSGAPCDPAIDNCPSGQTCTTSAEGSFCRGSGDGAGADGGSTGDAVDGACYGTGLVHDVCDVMSMTDLDITADRTINTAMVGGSNCDSIIAQPGGGASLCLISARSITIASNVKVTAIGANPLVMVATDTIAIGGTIDVASHVGSMSNGAGAETTCGNNGGGNGGNQDGAGAGGAGGSFGTQGGEGGNGFRPSGSGNASPGGTALAVIVPTSLRGGCPGGGGGSGGGGGGAGAPGVGGGAVYLIAATSITVSGTINASGGGGGQGKDGQNSSGGAGGGGSGGFIGLDSPVVAITGSIFANGGSGGGGGGNEVGLSGEPGKDPANATTSASGGQGGNNGGGDGGRGYANGTAPGDGNNGNNGYCGGGGGGGGAGIIRVYGAAIPSGMISPPAI